MRFRRRRDAMRTVQPSKAKLMNLYHDTPRSGNVLPFDRRAPRGVRLPGTWTPEQRPKQQVSERAAFQGLTHALVMDRARRGQLEPELVAYLLAGVGIEGQQP
jgi:hypothetical protein